MNADGDETEPVTGRRQGTQADAETPGPDDADRTTPLSPTEPRVLAGRYELRGLLGQGGMADVELAHDRVLDRQVAVKLLHTRYRDDPAFVTRFRREAQAAAGLNHANIVSVYDTGDADGRPFIVMEYVSGRSLRDLLRTEGVLPHRAAEIAGDAAAGLHYAHERDLVHRDVKPANIMVSDEGQVKVADFGIARALSADTMTQTAATFGTAAYVSPEQAQGQRVDRRSDIYSLGVVLYELMTGRQPFTGETAVALAYKHVQEAPTPPRELNPEISPQLEAVVLKALAKNPDNRYATARDFADDLRRAVAGSAVAAPAVLPYAETQALTAAPVREEPPAEPETPRRRRGLWVLLGLVLVAALVAGGLLLADLLAPTPLAEVPDVRGQSVASAQNLLTAEGFEARVAEEPVESTEYEDGLVAATDPEPGREAPQDTVVTLFLSGGPPTAVVPEVAGRTEAEAEELLVADGFGVGQRSTETSADVEEGHVIRTDPPGGSEAPEGSDVSLVVSEGPQPVTVPNVVNLTEDRARDLLEDEGLAVGSVGSAPSDEIPEGRVISSDPSVGSPVPPGTAVDLLLSEGSTTVTLPNVVGFPEQAAVATLEEFCGEPPCAEVTVDREFDEAPQGQVIAQSPEGGSSVELGSRVTIVVSEGPEPEEEEEEEETPPPAEEENGNGDGGNDGGNNDGGNGGNGGNNGGGGGN